MKLPKALYVKIADGGTGPDWLHADPDLTSLVEMGEKVRIGVYKLVGYEDAEGVVSNKPRPVGQLGSK